jgi:hypothetical protein
MIRVTGKEQTSLAFLAGSFFVRLDVEFAGICRIGVERLKRKGCEE